MTKQEFKRRWELNETGDGITFNDIAQCAIDWHLFTHPKTERMDRVRYAVLKTANTVDCEAFNPQSKD